MSYLMSRLSKPTIAWLNQITGAAKNRCDSFAIALAYVLSQKLMLPVERVEDIGMYYKLNHLTLMTRLIDDCNEIVPMNTKLVRQALEAFYCHRYRTLFPLAIPLALRPECPIEDFFGLSKSFSDNILETIKKDSVALTSFINQLTTMVEEIITAQKWTSQEEEQDRYVA